MQLEEVVNFLEEKLREKFKVNRVQRVAVGSKGLSYGVLWGNVPREALREAVKALKELAAKEKGFPHLAVISAVDKGEEIELIYHFELGKGSPRGVVPVNLSVFLPKEDPHVPSLYDLIPGALITEREKEEMMGVVVDGLPPLGSFFLPEDFPAGVYPWRKDEHGVSSLTRKLE